MTKKDLEEENKALTKELEHANFEISVLQEEVDGFEDRYDEGFDEGYAEGIENAVNAVENLR